MALDGAFLYLTAQEMRGILVGTRVEKIAQPSREELVMTFRLLVFILQKLHSKTRNRRRCFACFYASISELENCLLSGKMDWTAFCPLILKPSTSLAT